MMLALVRDGFHADASGGEVFLKLDGSPILHYPLTDYVLEAVADMPLYHFRPEDLRYAGVQFVPTRISASARGLVVAVEPVRQ